VPLFDVRYRLNAASLGPDASPVVQARCLRVCVRGLGIMVGLVQGLGVRAFVCVCVCVCMFETRALPPTALTYR
jgi:hypothetical protein